MVAKLLLFEIAPEPKRDIRNLLELAVMCVVLRALRELPVK